jgi:hypothetical protein
MATSFLTRRRSAVMLYLAVLGVVADAPNLERF